MKISQTFPSKFAKAADLNGKPVTLTIAKLIMEEMGFGAEAERKPVLYFQRATKGLVLNATNARTIAALYGDESDGWTGKRVTLYPTRVRAFGSMHDTIRIKEDMPPVPPARVAAQVEDAAEIDDVEDFTDADDEGHNSPTDGPAAPHVPVEDRVAPDDPLWDAPAPPRATQAELDALDAVGRAHYGVDAWAAKLPALVLGVTTGATSSARELKPTECARLIRKIESLQAAAVQATGQPAANGVAQGVA